MGNDLTLPLVRYSDGILQIAMEPSVPIGGWNIVCEVTKRFGGMSGLIIKSCASGYGGGQSGITVIDSGVGIFAIRFNSVDTSGFDPGDYALSVDRMDSGNRTPIKAGYLLLNESIGN